MTNSSTIHKSNFQGMLSLLTVLVAGILFFSIEVYAAAPSWDVTGSYVVNMRYEGSDYPHDMMLVQHDNATLTGSGGYPASGVHTYNWVIDSGSVSGDTIHFFAHYTASADAVTPLTTMHVMGTVASNGTMSGTWSDNYQGGSRSGTWSTTSGTADEIEDVDLQAEDFGVVNYDTDHGILKGYTAGFGLTNAIFKDVQSVVVKLYSGNILLQINTATTKVGQDVTGSHISSPFDVSGTFNYTADGYWKNHKKSQYGQSMPATKVVATVTLANGKVVTATNTNLTGDPTTIYPTNPKPNGDTPTKKSQCKKGDWQYFTDPFFRNQGHCVSYVNHLKRNNHSKFWSNLHKYNRYDDDSSRGSQEGKKSKGRSNK